MLLPQHNPFLFRFRGTDDCLIPSCPYRSQKTTHFHCNRTGCGFIFKNKADMEKHKNFHMKDEQLNKDGFKKFMKNDDCGFDGEQRKTCSKGDFINTGRHDILLTLTFLPSCFFHYSLT